MAMGKMKRTYKAKGKRGAKPKKQSGYALTKRVPRSFISKRADYCSFFRCTPIYISNNSTTFERGGITLTFSDVLNFSSWTTLFDQYRIDKCIIKFTPILTQEVIRPYDDTTNPGINLIPRLTTALDRDDVAAPLSFDDVNQRPLSRTKIATKAISWTFVPNRLVAVYRTGVSSGYKVDTASKDFLDCANSDIPHYGLKWALEAASPSNAYQYRIDKTLVVSLKNRRY